MPMRSFVCTPQSAFRDDRIGRSRKVIPQGYGHPGGYPPNRDGKRYVMYSLDIKKPRKPPKWHYLIPVYIGILRILGFSKIRSLDRSRKMLQKFAPTFWGILTPPPGGSFLEVFKVKTRVF